MKRKLRFFSLFVVLFSVFLLSACQKNTRNVYQEVKKSDEITWGVKADTRLFGLMSIKTGKIEGFEVDLANALTKEILGKNAKANFVQTTAKTKIPLLKNPFSSLPQLPLLPSQIPLLLQIPADES